MSWNRLAIRPTFIIRCSSLNYFTIKSKRSSLWSMIFLDFSCMCIVYFSLLTHSGLVTHICVGKLTIVGSDNGLSPERRQAIIWTNAGILLTGPLGTNLSEVLIEIQTFWLKKIRLKMSSAKCCSFRLGLNVLIPSSWIVGWESLMKAIITLPPTTGNWSTSDSPDAIGIGKHLFFEEIDFRLLVCYICGKIHSIYANIHPHAIMW